MAGSCGAASTTMTGERLRITSSITMRQLLHNTCTKILAHSQSDACFHPGAVTSPSLTAGLVLLCRVVGVTPLPQLSSLLAASLDKQLTMTDLERRIAVKTLTGAQLVRC
jgi:hypothetical protein